MSESIWPNFKLLGWPYIVNDRYFLMYLNLNKWAQFYSWWHIRHAHVAGKHSSWVHFCATEYRQLVTTCTYTKLSQKMDWHPNNGQNNRQGTESLSNYNPTTLNHSNSVLVQYLDPCCNPDLNLVILTFSGLLWSSQLGHLTSLFFFCAGDKPVNLVVV